MENTTLVSALRLAHRITPRGTYAVNAEALRKARQSVPTGDYHSA